MSQYHRFLSYARKDNESGWGTAFHRRLLAQHQRYSGRGLHIFFDQATEAIPDGADWERRIYSSWTGCGRIRRARLPSLNLLPRNPQSGITSACADQRVAFDPYPTKISR